MDVINQPLHVRKPLVGGRIAVRVTAGGQVVRTRRTKAPLPYVVDVDVAVALTMKAARDHSVRRETYPFGGDGVAPRVPRVPPERRRQRQGVLAPDDGDRARRLSLRIRDRNLDRCPAGPLERLPAGVLVTDRDSVARYEASRSGRFDYTGVNFLAAKASWEYPASFRSCAIARPSFALSAIGETVVAQAQMY